MPDKPIPEDDPVVSKSLAPHYLVAMLVLMATLFWALWDEDFGQRPWKAFQNEWKVRYSAFLKNAHSQSDASEKEVKNNPEYLALKQAYDKASLDAAPRIKEINEKLRDLGAQILAVQNTFTDRRAYVSASTYAIETETSASSKQSKQNDLAKYDAANAVILGVSVDSVDSHKQFCAKDSLTFKLLSDTEKKTTADYGSLSERGMASRNTFLIGPDGKIVKVWTAVKPQHHSEEVLAAIAEVKK